MPADSWGPFIRFSTGGGFEPPPDSSRGDQAAGNDVTEVGILSGGRLLSRTTFPSPIQLGPGGEEDELTMTVTFTVGPDNRPRMDRTLAERIQDQRRKIPSPYETQSPDVKPLTPWARRIRLPSTQPKEDA